MGADEAGTLERLKTHRRELIDPKIAEHRGRIVKLMGDGALVEFASVVDAVACAVEIQREMASRNAATGESPRIEFRIGINVGDVIVEGDDIYGDGVNIAARLESLAETGGICLSGDAYRQVKGKLTIAFEDLGEREVKNVADPIRVYRVVADKRGTDGTVSSSPTAKSPAEKPSIAVLPFTNMSGDTEQEYFSDGITEDIITELSRFRSLFVVARNSSFSYKGKSEKVQEIGRDLGVAYVVEGSVRKAGTRVRVTAQLIEASTGNHLWAERYDRELADIFAVQDELVRAISGAIPGQLDRSGVEHIRRKTPSSLTAYDCDLRGRWALAHWNEGLSAALEWYEKAIEADPKYAAAHAGIAMAYGYGLFVLGMPPENALAHAREHAQQAVVLDDRNPTVNAYAALAYMLCGDHKLAQSHAERAVFLNPNDPMTLSARAQVLTYTGDPAQALEWFAKSERLEPYAPDDPRLDCLCDCYYMLREYEKVIEIHAAYRNVPAFLFIVLAAAYAQAGNPEKAKAAIKEFERARPPEYDATTMITYQMRMCSRQEDRDHWLAGYRKAGLPV